MGSIEDVRADSINETLVETNNGCFHLTYGINDIYIFKQNNLSNELNYNLLYDNESNRSIVKNIARDYYSRFKSKSVDSKFYVWIIKIEKKSSTNFELEFAFYDQKYKQYNNIINSPYSYRCKSTYSIYNQNNEWNFNYLSTDKSNYCN